MQQLHIVGVTTELDRLILSARKGAKSGSYALPLDAGLLEMISDAVRHRAGGGDQTGAPSDVAATATGPGRHSRLTPREIQDRIRAGRSLDEIAAQAGVDEEWVARFSAPVEAERLQIVGRVRAFVYSKPRRGESGEPLGLSVRWNLADRGVRLTNDEFDRAWSAYQIADHVWMVTFSFVSRQRSQRAEWEVDLRSGELVGRNRLASDLGYLEPGRRRRSVAFLQPTGVVGNRGRRKGPLVGAADEDATPPASRRVAKPVSATKAPAQSGPPRKSVAAKKASGKKAAARKAVTKKAAAKKAVTKRAAAKMAAARKPGVRKTPAGKLVAAPPSPGAPRQTSRRTAKAAPRPTSGANVPARRAGESKRAAKNPPTKAAKSPGGRKPAPGARRPSGADVPPEIVDTVVAPPARPEPNELGQRRLQLVSGKPSPAPYRPKSATAPGPSPARPASGSPRSSAPPSSAAPTDDIADTLPAAESSPGDEAESRDAEARRLARRAARATRTGAEAAEGPHQAAASPSSPSPLPHPLRPLPPLRLSVARPPPRRASPAAVDLPPGDGGAVTIRADRAAPANGEGVGDVILPPAQAPLRAARPPVEPPRRRFNRSTR